MSLIFRTAAAGLAAAVALAVPAEAQAPSRFRMNLGYDGRLVVKVLDISISQTADNSTYSSSVKLRSYGVLSAFKKIEQSASARGRIDNGVAKPAVFTHQNHVKERARKVEARWTGADVVTVASPAYNKMGDPPASRAQRLEAVDPVTNLLRFALADSQADFCRGTVKFYDGKQRYDLTFSGRTTVQPNAREKKLGLVNPVQCRVVYREVAGFKKKPPEKKNQGLKKPITMSFAQVGQGGPWVISSITGSTPLGNAVIELQRVNTSGETPED
ncbi:MAG TPA: DUF3108 domain-containing protein [Caulobacteraceae bacterium]|nr:DUF3108 domain-containing protein [Caulobacteraceae bacterium]